MRPSIHIRERARVILIDDSNVALDGLQAALSKSSRILVVGIARTEGEAVTLLRTSQPEVVILDVRIGRASGINLCEVIRESYPKTAVLFFTADDDKYTMRSAMLAGAHGYLLKGASKEAIVKSIETVASGQTIIDQRLTQHLLAWIRDGKRTVQRERKRDCSSLDLRLLSLVAAGKSNKEIARELNVTPTAVADYLRAIYKRLNVSKRSEAVRYVV
jgi:two-component system response regulator DevR